MSKLWEVHVDMGSLGITQHYFDNKTDVMVYEARNHERIKKIVLYEELMTAYPADNHTQIPT
jgi:hypothetical protein